MQLSHSFSPIPLIAEIRSWKTMFTFSAVIPLVPSIIPVLSVSDESFSFPYKATWYNMGMCESFQDHS